MTSSSDELIDNSDSVSVEVSDIGSVVPEGMATVAIYDWRPV